MEGAVPEDCSENLIQVEGDFEMTTLTRFVPFRSSLNDVAVLQNRLNSIFNGFALPEGEQESLAMGNFIPPVDVYEDAHQLVLKLEVPGIKQEDLDVQLENQMLTVKGERKFEKTEKEENFHRIERRYGSFTRSFTLPTTVDVGSVKASYEHGVLCIALEKKEAAKPKQVKVEIGSGAVGPQPKHIEGKTAA
jgi:HSP20 family protein